MKRGNLLWTGSRMMLAEHRQLINERMKLIPDADVELEPDEQLLEEWQEVWSVAATNGDYVLITSNNKSRTKQKITKQKGRIVGWDNGAIYLQTEDDERVKVLINQIIDFKLGV